MANMKLIEAKTVGAGGIASIEFTSIPQTYTDLVVKISGRLANNNTTVYIDYNNTTSNQSWRRLYDSSGTTGSDTSSRQLIQMPDSTYTADVFGNVEIYIPNYTSSNNKSSSVDSVNENNSATNINAFLSNNWSDSAAISSLKIVPLANNIVEHSTAYLYGVSNTIASGAKATGGYVTEDANYFYHTFLSSGTFTPTQSLTCDYLIVAGGGGGGNNNGGGAAGGLRSTVTATGGGGSLESQISLTAQAYAITVGAGGVGQTYTNRNSVTSGSNSSIIGGAVSITSTGGGYGGNDQRVPATGGSGGGGSYLSPYNTGASASPSGQGFAGGNGFNGSGGNIQGGGGGGAGAVGQNGATVGTGGVGGAGVAISAFANATGTSDRTYYAGGGGGGYQDAAGGIGGIGGGGDSGYLEGPARSGIINTGGGGGASSGGSGTSGNGGSGLVIVRYAK
jgi:hypothetical protein